jgi:hypothetical protein
MENTELRDAIERTADGVYDPEARKKALQQMKETREILRKRMGVVDLVVPILREIRDE